MIVVYFHRDLPYYQQVLLDAAVMTVIIFPLLYVLSSQPLLQHIQQRVQTESILQARLRLIQFAQTRTLDELLQMVLDELEALTGSTMGYFHFLEADQNTLQQRAWSTNTLQQLRSPVSRDRQFEVYQDGIWMDCVHEQRPVIYNDRSAQPSTRDLPAGLAPIHREMAVPIMRDGKIVAILGLANKPQNFTNRDVELVSTLADFSWDVVRDKQASVALSESEEKFRTLVTWTYDWEIWLDPRGNVVYTSPSCERITGYSPEELITAPDLITRIIHPDDQLFYTEHQKLIHAESAGIEKLEYRVIARNGQERWIEHICRPLFGANNTYLGRRISNRDITEQKQAEEDIRQRNQKEKLLTQTIHTMQLEIARDLHDTIGQNISFLRMKLEHLAAKKIRKQAEIQLEIQTMSQAANESYDLMRGTIAILQSVNSTDLHRLFTRYAEQIEERAGFQISFSSRGEPKSLSAPQLRQIFYIFREILNNIEKHANASEVNMQMSWAADHLNLVVADNGQGFDLNQLQFGSHYGLRFMRERVKLLNGSLDLHSTVGQGTRVTVLIPYEPA